MVSNPLSSEQFNILKVVDNTNWYTIAKVGHIQSSETYIIKTNYQKENRKLSKTLIQHDYRMLQQLKGRPFVPVIDSFIENKNEDLIVMIDDNSKPLGILREEGKFTWDLFFAISTQLALALQEIHSLQIVHGNLTPTSIFFTQQTRKLKIIDFSWAFISEYHGIGHLIPNEFHFPKHAYLSFEQMGKINSNIDHRSDFYSMGKIFTEIITGVPIEFIQIESAIPFSQFPFIPKIIKDFLLKLMAKDPIDRYQTSFALVKDLTYIHSLYSGKGQFKNPQSEFTLGKYDVPRKLQITNSMHGPKLFIHDMLNYYKFIQESGKALIILQAPFGHGKKKSIKEFLSCLPIDSFYFYEGCVQNTNNSQHLIEWKEITNNYFSSKDSSIPKMIEDFFLQKNDRPHILYLNNADSMSLESISILKSLMVTKNIHSLFIVLEINSQISKPLMHLFKFCEFNAVYKIKGKIFNIHPLDLKNIQTYLSQTLFIPQENIRELAKVIYAKSYGSDFLLNELILHCYENKLIYYDTIKGSWEYEISRINQIQLKNTVQEYIKNKYINGPVEIKKFMLICSILDTPFTRKNIEDLFKVLSLQNKKYDIDWEHYFLQFIQDKIFYAKGPFYQLVPEEIENQYHWSYCAWQDIIIECSLPQELHELSSLILEEHKFVSHFSQDYIIKLFTYTQIDFCKKHPTFFNTLYFWIKSNFEQNKNSQTDLLLVPFLVKNHHSIWGQNYPVNINDYQWPFQNIDYENADDFYRYYFIYYYSILACIQEKNYSQSSVLLEILKTKIELYPGPLTKYYQLFNSQLSASFYFSQGLFMDCMTHIHSIFRIFKMQPKLLFDKIFSKKVSIENTPYNQVMFNLFVILEKCSYFTCKTEDQNWAKYKLLQFVTNPNFPYKFIQIIDSNNEEISNQLEELLALNDSSLRSRGVLHIFWKFLDYEKIIELCQKGLDLESRESDSLQVILLVYLSIHFNSTNLKAQERNVFFNKLNYLLNWVADYSYTNLMDVNQIFFSYVNQEKNKSDLLESWQKINDSVTNIFSFVFFHLSMLRTYCLMGVQSDLLKIEELEYKVKSIFKQSYIEYQFNLLFFYYNIQKYKESNFIQKRLIKFKMNSLVDYFGELAQVNERRFFACANITKIVVNNIDEGEVGHIAETILSKNHPANYNEELGLLYLITKNYTKAIKIFEEMEFWMVKIYLERMHA